MKIISWNVNGLKSVLRKNFLNWIENSKAEIVCLQEIKMHLNEMKSILFKPKDFLFYFNSGKRKRDVGSSCIYKRKAN
jgi:exodeoxyribonuclease-3